MAPIKSEGIILKKMNYRETSVILTLFTEEMGKIKGVLKGVRSEKSKIPPATFTPGAYIFTFIYKKKSNLHLLSSPSLINSFEMEKRKNLKAWHLSLKLINLFTQEGSKEKDIFNLLKTAGFLYSKTETPEIIFTGFKIKLIKILGYGIELEKCVSCRKNSKYFLFSGKLGGILCKECAKKDVNSIRISPKVLNVMKQMNKMDFEKFNVIKKIPKEILEKINFYSNITLNYHSEIENIWWNDEKYII